MAEKPTYEELEQRIKKLESAVAGQKRIGKKRPIDESHYKILFEAANDSIFIMEDYRFVECNKMTLEIYGCEKPYDILGFYPWDFSPLKQPDGSVSKEKAIAMMDNSLSGNPQRFYWKHIKKNGNEFDAEVSLNSLEIEGTNSLLAIVRDITGRKHAEDALRENEARMRSLGDNLPGGMTYQLDMGEDGQERQFTYVSAGVEKIHEVTADAVQQDAGLLYDQIIEEDRQLIAELETQAQATMTPFVAEVRFRLPSGAVRWRLLTSAPRKAPNEHLIWDGVEIDITERKQAEQRLQASEERYRGLMNTMQDIVHSVSVEGAILFIGPQVKRYGFTEDELVSQPFADFILPEDLDVVLRDFQHTLSTGEQMITTFRIVAKDGNVVWFEETGQAVRDDGGNIISISGILRDVTEKRRAEEALRDSERKLHAIFDHHYQLTGLVDTEGRLLAANRTALRFADAKESEVVGQYFWDGPWWDKSQRSELQKAVKRAVKGEFVRFETTHPTADGQIRDIDFSLSPVRDDDGNVIYVVPEGRDITEIKQTEQEKVLLKEQLQQAQKMEAIGTLAGGIAHDFNNILSPILIHTEMALMDLPPDSPIRLNLEDVLEAGQRARELVKQILAFSRQSEEERHPVRIRPIIEDALKLLRASLPSTIEIQEELKSESDTVLADATQIHQVLMNLCTNASHAMRSKGGVLQVRLDNVILNKKITEIQDLSPGSYLRLTVSDTGEGMDQAVLDRIFDPYYTTKGKGEGTGLGLAVVQGIVKDYSGAITVHSEPGKGAIFKVYLPHFERKVDAETEMAERIPRGNETILLVDDEKAIIDANQAALERLGYHVIARTSSIEALEVFHFQPDKIDLVITDQTMPNMTGEDLTRELLALRPDLPIILCTGFSEIMNEEKAKAIGIQEFIVKPIIVSKLANAIRKVLDKSD